MWYVMGNFIVDNFVFHTSSAGRNNYPLRFEQEALVMAACSTSRFLAHTEGFRFEARSRDCLPEGFPEHIKGTCYFLTGFVHPKVDPSEPLDAHIRKAQRELRLDASQTWLA